jgi:hypothetical protein
MIDIKPQCHPSFNETTNSFDAPKMSVAYVGRGFLLPCCWCDNQSGEDFENLNFFEEHLRVSNVKDITEIFKSKQWIHFHKTILLNPNNAPKICKTSCGVYEK